MYTMYYELCSGLSMVGAGFVLEQRFSRLASGVVTAVCYTHRCCMTSIVQPSATSIHYDALLKQRLAAAELS